jgi:hypothetical protein
VYKEDDVYYKDGKCTIPLTDEDSIFSLYAYTANTYKVGKYNLRGMRETTVKEKDFPFGTYYYLRSYSFLKAKTYDPDITYYVEEPFVFYYDMANPTQTIASVDTYERIKKLVDIIGDQELLNDLNEYSSEILIDGSKITLDEIGRYEINVSALYSSIEIDCGVVLECGYEAQIINYVVESSSDNAQLKRAKQNYEDIMYYLNSDTMKSMCLPYSGSSKPDE